MTRSEKSSPQNFNRNPLLWLAACFASGIATAKFAAVDWRAALIVCVAVGITAVVFRKKAAATLFVFISFFFAGTISFQSEKFGIRPDRLRVIYDAGEIPSGDAVEIEGMLAGRPEPAFDGHFLILRAEKLWHRGIVRTGSGKARLFVPTGNDARSEISNLKSQISNLKYGSRIRVLCSLERDDEFLNPGVIRKHEMLDHLGVDVSSSLKSSLLVEHLADESVFLPLAWVYDARANLIETFRSNLSVRSAGVMIASLLGNKYYLDRETAELFRDGGTFHILIISGLHITFIGGFLLLLIRQFTRNRVIQFTITNTLLWAYTLAVGADIPVVRAALMFSIISFSYVIYRQGSPLNSLGMCTLILLIWRPSDLFSASFQLTFISVAAIIACAFPLIGHLRKIGSWTPTANTPFPPKVPEWLKHFCEMLYWRDEKWNVEAKRNIWSAKLFKSSTRITEGLQLAAAYLFEAFLISLIVQIWMLPLTVVYFHRVSFASILLNIWVGIFIALESLAAVLGAAANYFSVLLATGFFAFAEVFNWLMLLLPRLFSDNGWESFRLPAYSGGGQVVYFLYFMPIIFFAFVIYRWKPFNLIPAPQFIRSLLLVSAGALAILSGAIIFHPFSAPKVDGRLRLDFLDVGQGDSIFVTFPNGQTMLIDGGGRFDYRKTEGDAEPFERDVRGIGEAVVSETLWHQGYSGIDYILATHAHADHIEGLGDVARNFSIRSAILARTPQDDPDYAEFVEILNRRSIPIEIVGRGDVLKFGGAMLEVIYPVKRNITGMSNNNDSIVVRIVFGSRSFLLTGDIERQAENELAAVGLPASDLVKVAHHGSRTSSIPEFIVAARPRYAIISVGRRSMFGHPHSEIVERWRAAGAEVLTTGERGMITVSTDGTDLIVETSQNRLR